MSKNGTEGNVTAIAKQFDSEDYSEPDDGEDYDEVQDGIDMQAEDDDNGAGNAVLVEPIADVAVFSHIPDSTDQFSEAVATEKHAQSLA